MKIWAIYFKNERLCIDKNVGKIALFGLILLKMRQKCPIFAQNDANLAIKWPNCGKNEEF